MLEAQHQHQGTPSVCDVCHCCSSLMKTKLSTPTGSGRYYPRRLLSMGTPPPDENNPPSNSISPSQFSVVRQLLRGRVPLEDHDMNSQDSGYAVSEDSKSPASAFSFVEPSGFAPRRLSSMESSRRNLLLSSFSSMENSQSSSTELSDDGFLELSQGDRMEEDTKVPLGLGTLLSGPILCDRSQEENRTPVVRRNYRLLRRTMSERPYTAIGGSRFQECSPQSEESAYSLKRPPQRPQSPPISKRHKPLTNINNQRIVTNNNTVMKTKGTLFQYGFTKTKPSPLSSSNTRISSPPRRTVKPLYHSLSDSGISIKMALQRSTQEDLIGDFTRPFALPLMSGKHRDLKSISCETLGKLIDGEYSHKIASYRIIDCRYPYEFEGGHIKGAVNLYTQEQVRRELVDNRMVKFTLTNQEEEKRHILVFHCEFSSERGPRLSRFLRIEDRNDNVYPRLHYPELYLLNGGYSAFFQTHSHLCEPMSYRPMHDPDHSSEFKHFRAKSKTWSNGSNRKGANKGLSRLGF